MTMTTDIVTPAQSGIWLPLVTLFRDGAIDAGSLRRLFHHYLQQPIDGIILAGTTGEAMTLRDDEIEQMIEIGAAEVAGRLPVHIELDGLEFVDQLADFRPREHVLLHPAAVRAGNRRVGVEVKRALERK